jgi:hypothetical protein
VRLYSRASAGAIDDPAYGHFEPDEDHGGFDLPDELADRLHSMHVRKKPMWETEMERDERLHGEESARRRDPETLYNAVADIANVTKQLAGLQLGAHDEPQVAKLTAEVETLRKQLAEAQASADDTPAKTTRTRRSSGT